VEVLCQENITEDEHSDCPVRNSHGRPALSEARGCLLFGEYIGESKNARILFRRRTGSSQSSHVPLDLECNSGGMFGSIWLLITEK